MARKIIPLVTGESYHIYNRGVDKRSVFLDVSDYLRFYTSLLYFNSTEPTTNYIEARRFSKDLLDTDRLIDLHAYCLLPNHFHLLLTQKKDDGISEYMKRISGGFTSYFNEKYERSGSLFQGRFKRSHLTDNEQLMHLSTYVNYNHEVHNIKTKDELYLSSKAIYSGKKEQEFIKSDLILNQFSTRKEYVTQAVKYSKFIRNQRSEKDKYLLHE